MKEKVVRILSITIVLIMSYCAMSQWLNGEILLQPLISGGDTTIYDSEYLKYAESNFEYVGKDTFISKTDNAGFALEATFPVRTIVINVKQLDDTQNARVFYASSDSSFCLENSKQFTLKIGKNYIYIPESGYKKLRLDLAETVNTEMTIEQIDVFRQEIISRQVLLLIFLVLLGEVVLLIALFKSEIFIKQLIKRTKGRMGEHNYCLCILGIAILTTAIFVYGQIIISGNEYVYYDIGGGDQPETYIPQFVYYINAIRSGTLSTWNFSNGLGTSSLPIIGFLLNPFILVVFIVCILFGIQYLNSMLLVAQILNVLISGLLCFKYLESFEGTEYSKSVASYIYSFNGFLILFSQHYVVMDFGFYCICTLIIIEKVISSERVGRYYYMFTLWCALLFCRSVYMGYMVAIFAGIYTIFRILQKTLKYTVQDTIGKALRMLGFACIGIMCAAPILIPSVSELLLNSDRIVGNDSGFFQKIGELLFSTYPAAAYRTIFLRLFSNNLEGTGNNYIGLSGTPINDYYAPPTLFFSLFFLTFFVINCMKFYQISKKSKIKGIIYLAILILIGFVMFNPLGSALFNALVDPFGRYSFLMMPIFAIMVMSALDYIKMLNLKERKILILTNIFMLCLVGSQVYVGLSGNKSKLTYFSMLECLLLISLLFLLFFWRRLKEQNIIRIFIFLIFINVTVESYMTINARDFCSFSRKLVAQEEVNTYTALDSIAETDDELYRVEKNYYDLIYFNDGLLQDYRGVSTYNSTLNSNVKEFYRLYCNPAINYYGYDSFWFSFLNVSNDVIQNSLMGVKYILSDGTAYPSSNYYLLHDNKEINVYRNEAVQSFGMFYENTIPKSEVLHLNDLQRQHVLQKAVVLEDNNIINKKECVDYADIQAMINLQTRKNLTSNIKIVPTSRVYLEKNGEEQHFISDESVNFELLFEPNQIDEKEYVWLEFLADINYENNMKMYFITQEGEEKYEPYYFRGKWNGEWQGVRALIPSEVNTIRIECSAPELSIKNLKLTTTYASVMPNEYIPVIKIQKNNLVQGTIQNSVSGYLFLPIPYEQGWTAKIDNQVTTILQADSGFQALYMEPGTHTFELKYNFPNLIFGVIIGLLGMLLFIMIVLVRRRNAKQIKEIKHDKLQHSSIRRD